MGRYAEVFPGRRTVLPVVHVDSLEQARLNAKVARKAGADGVFLINHGMRDEQLLGIHAEVRLDHPGWWVGVNCLGLPPETAFSMISGAVDGLWVDDAGVDERLADQPYAVSVDAVRRAKAPRCLYFGGTAFKYRRPVADLETACKAAARHMDVVTTSGPGTGHAADLEKIRRMKAALGDFPLAIASGITPENVVEYLPYVDSLLVATGISRSFTELDPAKVRDLVETVQQYDG